MGTSVKVLIVGLVVAAVIAVVAVKSGDRASSPGEPQQVATSAADVDSSPASSAPAPAERTPKLLDLGSTSCIPCKQMAPILEGLKTEYAGRLEVEFTDIYADPAAAERYDIRVIPTQVFISAEGKELFRHEGFFGKEDILAKWQELGVSLGQDG